MSWKITMNITAPNQKRFCVIAEKPLDRVEINSFLVLDSLSFTADKEHFSIEILRRTREEHDRGTDVCLYGTIVAKTSSEGPLRELVTRVLQKRGYWMPPHRNAA